MIKNTDLTIDLKNLASKILQKQKKTISKPVDCFGNTILHWMAAAEIMEILEHPLVDNVKNHFNQTPLHLLADRKRIEVLNHNSVDKVKDSNGCTPLHLLSYEDGLTGKELCLILAHSSVDKVIDDFGYTPLHGLSLGTNLSRSKISLILQHPSVDQIKNAEGQTPLHFLGEGGFVPLFYLKEKYPWFPFRGCRKVTVRLINKILNTSNAEKFILGF